jgi:hypothetical protein
MIKIGINVVIFVSLAVAKLPSPTSDETNCYGGWYRDYHIGALEAYNRADMSLGELIPLADHVCTGWDPGYWHDKVTVRPLYNDSGLPVYKIFLEELYVLVGFEFRTWDPCMRKGWGDHNGFSVALSEREDFLWKTWP